MKISKISFKNIHSLRGEHHIDFLSGPLAESGLFAITGATGSGKSTLLDIITLALYNKVPRIGSISKSVIEGEGGIMTRNAQDCFAEVEYIVNDKTYRSHWSIERNRNNNLNDRKQEIIEVSTGAIIESGKSSVPDKNAALIGLSYDQFVKAMVLSQGQFSKLLKAKRDERNKLLEDITGAKDYREIGKAVFQRYRKATKARDEQEIRLHEIELIPKEEKKGLISQEIAIKKNIVSQKKELDLLKVEIDNQKGIVKNETILKNNEKQQKELSSAIENFRNEEVALKKHSKYVAHTKLISNFEQKDKEYKENAAELIRQQKKEIEVLKNKDTLLEQASKLLKKQVETEDYPDHLTRLSKEVMSLKKEEDLAMTAVKLHEENIKKILLDINKNAQRIRFNPEPDIFMKSIKPVEEKVDDFLKISKIDKQEDLAEKEAKVKSKLELVNKLRVELTEYNSILKTKSSKETELKASEGLFKRYQHDLKKLEEDLKLLQTKVDKLTEEEENRKKHQSLEEHRKALADGKACPLCGALEHPFASKNPVFDLKEEVLKSKTTTLNITRDLKTSTQTNLENERKKSEVLRQNIVEINKAIKPNYTNIEKLCESLQVEIIKDIDTINDLEVKLSRELQLVERVKKAFELRKLLENLTQIAKQWITSSDLKIKKEAERKQLYDGGDIESEVQSLINMWTANIQNISHVKQWIASSKIRIRKISEDLENFKKELDKILKNENIESVERLKTFILSEVKAEEIRKKKNDLQLQQELLNTEKTNALKEVENFKKLVTTNEPIAVLESKHKKVEEEFENLNVTIGTIKARLDADKEAEKKQKNLLAELQALKKEEALWKTMNSLIGDANGKRFSNFVQDLTLEQLIGYTNMRLKDLSDRYILDIPTANEADKNDALKVFDSHQGDARRSINTLSGGETFMVSLAMAFALSDLAAKNVKIESIFIDEGFGTLDADTLNQAITILEKMQNEGDKSIGVISHVEALKERISTQIKIEKTSSGYSTIEIV